MGGIVIDILGKSIFFGSTGSQNCTKNAIFPQGGLLKPPASCRVNSDITFNARGSRDLGLGLKGTKVKKSQEIVVHFCQ